MITITDTALAFFTDLLEKSGFIGADRGIRIGIKGGGCHGYEYYWSPVPQRDKGDHVMLLHGIRFFIDPKSMTVLSGTEIDRSQNLLEKPLVFKNENVKSTCGCGTSFELKDKKDKTP